MSIELGTKEVDIKHIYPHTLCQRPTEEFIDHRMWGSAAAMRADRSKTLTAECVLKPDNECAIGI
jgi:hypothetical protein